MAEIIVLGAFPLAGSAAGFVAAAAGRLAGRGVAKCAGGGAAALGTSLGVIKAQEMGGPGRPSADLGVIVFFGGLGGLATLGFSAGGLVGWGAHFFCKMPRDPKTVSWHQDNLARKTDFP